MSPDARETIRENVKRYLEAGVSFSKLSRDELEEAVRQLLSHNTSGREIVGDLVEEVRARSRRGMEHLAEFVRAEVHREMESIIRARQDEASEVFERAFTTFGDFLRSSARTATRSNAPKPDSPTHSQPPEAVSEHDVPAKKAPAKRAPAKKTPVKRASATTGGAAAAPAKKAPAKKAGVKKAPAKKTAAKRNT